MCRGQLDNKKKKKIIFALILQYFELIFKILINEKFNYYCDYNLIDLPFVFNQICF